jgi:hypothetical protein
VLPSSAAMPALASLNFLMICSGVCNLGFIWVSLSKTCLCYRIPLIRNGTVPRGHAAGLDAKAAKLKIVQIRSHNWIVLHMERDILRDGTGQSGRRAKEQRMLSVDSPMEK